MESWTIFTVGGILLTLMLLGGASLSHRSQTSGNKLSGQAEDTKLLYLLLWLASLSVLAYIAFAFGKRG